MRLLNRQITIANTNQKLLEKSILKLISLDYSNIEGAIFETRKKPEMNKDKEMSKSRNLLLAFILFIITCLLISRDRIRTKFK